MEEIIRCRLFAGDLAKNLQRILFFSLGTLVTVVAACQCYCGEEEHEVDVSSMDVIWLTGVADTEYLLLEIGVRARLIRRLS